MFTGLVDSTGIVTAVEPRSEGVRLTIETPLAAELGGGDSIAVSGVCLTAVGPDERRFHADVMAETLRRSALAPLAAGDSVNLELPVRPSDRLGGHIVQGHVDGTGTVTATEDEGIARLLTVEPDETPLLRYMAEKGSISIDGVSLTVASLTDRAFTVSLIPETLERTTLGEAAPGRKVNLEVDIVAKYVERLVA